MYYLLRRPSRSPLWVLGIVDLTMQEIDFITNSLLSCQPGGVIDEAALQVVLDSGQLAKGQKVAGWVNFEVPSNLRDGLVLLWEYDLMEPAVEIDLG